MEKDTQTDARLRPFSADFETIRTIHRGSGAYVAFQARTPQSKSLETLGACLAEELPERLPKLLELYPEDLYFTINSHAAGKGQGKDGLQWALRKQKFCRHLNAIIADLDVGRPGMSGAAGLTINEALQQVTDDIQDKRIPQPSLIAESGRGLYIVWLLHHHNDPTTPPRSYKPENQQHKRVSSKIIARLEHLGADKAASDTARVLRVGGSINSKNGQQVVWHAIKDENGNLTTYALGELEKLLTDPKERKGEHYGRRTKQPGSCPKRKAGAIERAKRRVSDVEKIEAERGGWKQGTRWTRLSLYAQLLRGTNHTHAEITSRVEAMAARCEPAFPSEPSDGTVAQIVTDALDRTHHARLYKTETLTNLLEVTEMEARRLELRSILPTIVQSEKREQTQSSKRPAKRNARQEAIDHILAAKPKASAADVRAELETQNIKASAATIKRDLAEMYPNRERQQAGRPKKEKQQAKQQARASISNSFEPIFQTPIQDDKAGILPHVPRGEAAPDSAPHIGQWLLPIAPAFPNSTFNERRPRTPPNTKLRNRE